MLRVLTPENKHFTFGYYDRCPFSSCGNYHLALEIPHQKGLPNHNEEAVVNVIDLRTGYLKALSSTFAWNHQQGAMTQWLSYDNDHIIFNDRDGDRVYSKVIDRVGKLKRTLPMPVYCLTKDGRKAASLNFARIQRRGYSYAISNPNKNGVPDLPNDDGVWLMDTLTGETKLILSYADIAKVHPNPEEIAENYAWLNHCIFNCDDSRLMVLFRYRIENKNWKTFLYTFNLDGSDIRIPVDANCWSHTGISHQEWGRVPNEILIDANFRGRGSELTVISDSVLPKVRHLASGIKGTGHHFFSPDGKKIVLDSYPQNGVQRLVVANVDSGEYKEFSGMNHDESMVGTDWRCDLHPRWKQDGTQLSIDSIHDGFRRIYLLDVS